ncbi:hypothetical protein HQ587_02450 [bacterium]|nr:hypothetical protein [bacterium]
MVLLAVSLIPLCLMGVGSWFVFGRLRDLFADLNRSSYGDDLYNGLDANDPSSGLFFDF